jgi:hypothetical protein
MVKVSLALLFIAFAGGYADNQDYNSAYVDYCIMVNEGHWPNFKNWECDV